MKSFVAGLLLALSFARGALAAEALGEFFESDFPFFQSQIDFSEEKKEENIVVRGIVIGLGSKALAFDQDLLRVAGIWEVPSGQALLSLANMAQTSYAQPHRKAGALHSKPTGPASFVTALKPGAGKTAEALTKDPRTPNPKKDLGRGALPRAFGHFGGIEIRALSAILHYEIDGSKIQEWHELQGGRVLRHLEISARSQPLYFGLCPGTWVLESKQLAKSGASLGIASNSKALSLEISTEGLRACLAPSNSVQRVTLAMEFDQPKPWLEPTPALPKTDSTRRWKEAVNTKGQLEEVRNGGLVMDRLPLPEPNPWQRRVRSSDFAFLSQDRAALLTYDGDVWLVDGLADPQLSPLQWRRFASGLHESLALAIVGDQIQVATKNGLVRLKDRDGNGEADWYENFSDAMRQSQSTRSFPLDMDLGPDGSTYVSQGGIALGGAGTPFTGSIARISPDGLTADLISTGAREPYLAVHPRTGTITGSDQQGNFVPSSLCYLVRPGDNFGFGEENPKKLCPPMCWIPHTEDNSSSSQLWMLGQGPFQEHLIHLSYGSGRLFLICPDLEAPTPQGAVIPLTLQTGLPLLQGREHPDGASLFVTGFQVYDSRTPALWGLARIRLSGDPITTPVNAVSCPEGVILRFDSALDPTSIHLDAVEVQSWNYLRSKQYGSGRYQQNGQSGMDQVGISQVVLSADRRSVFIQLPTLKPVMQLEVRHQFKLEQGPAANGITYFTIHEPHPLNLSRAGFPKLDLSPTALYLKPRRADTASVETGKALSQTLGCVGCHSMDGSTEGKTGPSWKSLFGKDRQFTDGSIESANEFYIKDSILNPERKIVKGFLPGMPSYKGVLNEVQIESVILYIQSLQ